MTTHALTRLSSTRFLVVRSFRLQRELLRDPSADCCARGDDRSLDEQGGCVCGVRGRDNGQREVVEREGGGGGQRETQRERQRQRQRDRERVRACGVCVARQLRRLPCANCILSQAPWLTTKQHIISNRPR